MSDHVQAKALGEAFELDADTLTTLLRLIERGMPVAPQHICGPNSNCDGECVDFAYAIAAKHKLQRVVAEATQRVANSTYPRYEAGIREQARREQMEADCKVRCVRCLHGVASLPGAVFGHQTSQFGWEPCKANDIRAAYAKAEQQRKGGTTCLL